MTTQARREKEIASEERTMERINSLETQGKILVTRLGAQKMILVNPHTGGRVEFWPTRGTITRNRVKQVRHGLDAALKLIGVKETA